MLKVPWTALGRFLGEPAPGALPTDPLLRTPRGAFQTPHLRAYLGGFFQGCSLERLVEGPPRGFISISQIPVYAYFISIDNSWATNQAAMKTMYGISYLNQILLSLRLQLCNWCTISRYLFAKSSIYFEICDLWNCGRIRWSSARQPTKFHSRTRTREQASTHQAEICLGAYV